MTVTIILPLIMCALLFLMIWAATYFYPWVRLLEFFPKDIEEKAKQHKPPFPAAPAIGWIIMALCMLGFIDVIVYGGWDGVQRGYTFGQFLVRFLVILLGVTESTGTDGQALRTRMRRSKCCTRSIARNC